MPISKTLQGVSFSSGAIPALGNPGTGVGVRVATGEEVGRGVSVGAALGVGEDVGVGLGVKLGVGVAVGEGVGVGVGVGVAVGATHVDTVIASEVVETVPPKAKALPDHVTVLPIVIPAASMIVPMNVELAPSVVAAVGAQKTSQDDAPLVSVMPEFATDVSAPLTLKMYVPLPLKVIPPVPMDAAPEVQ